MSEADITKLSCAGLRAEIDKTIQTLISASWEGGNTTGATSAHSMQKHDEAADKIDYYGKLLPVLLDEVFRRVHPEAARAVA